MAILDTLLSKSLSKSRSTISPADPAKLSLHPPRTDWTETVAADEESYFRAVVAEINALQSATANLEKRRIDRGFHAKTHASVRAQLKVLPLPSELAQGVCRKPETFEAWVRFSNGQGTYRADRQGDIRGMAVKILDVPGVPLSPPERSLDFLNILTPTQPSRNIKQFMAFVRASQNPRTMPLVLARDLGVKEGLRMVLWGALNINLAPQFRSVVSDYFTPLPIRWGPYAAKVSFAARVTPARGANVDDPDYLRQELARRLEVEDLRWDMMVQLYTDPKRTPIEDASVPWKPSSSPYFKVAELTVFQTDLNAIDAASRAVRDKLTFTPWHAPEEHRPLGSLMRARRSVYQASARLRSGEAARAANDTSIEAPTNGNRSEASAQTAAPRALDPSAA